MNYTKRPRMEDYVFNCNGRDTFTQRVFEKQLVSKALLELKWTRHVPMGCDKKGHREDISALDIDDGDELLLLGSHRGSISIAKYKYLSRRKWRKPMTLNLQRQALKTVKWCPLDLRLFMVSTASGWMRVCDTTMEKEVHGKKFEGEVYFDWNEHNTTNSRVAVADGSASMKVIDFRLGMNLPQMIRWDDKPIDVVQWYPSKHHYLYAGRRDGTIGVFDIRSSRGVLATKKIHKAQLYGLRLSADGLRVISSDYSGVVHVADTWDFSTKGVFRSDSLPVSALRRPDLQVANCAELYVVTNIHKLTLLQFLDGSSSPRQRVVEARALWDKPVVFRESSYELITGFNFNYLNILSLQKSSEDDEDADSPDG